jgi:hypothetical protein
MTVLVSSSYVKLSAVMNKMFSQSVLQELSAIISDESVLNVQCHVDKHYVKQCMTEEMLDDTGT